VAISDNELLTNCHVTGDLAEVRIARAKDEMPAKVVSRNADADRCVLRTETKLAKWVTVRPYDDIKVGERAITIGTPQGLELTAAEGIVSSAALQPNAWSDLGADLAGPSGRAADARGHLLGITTFYFRGGQNLNFAVAAEEYDARARRIGLSLKVFVARQATPQRAAGMPDPAQRQADRSRPQALPGRRLSHPVLQSGRKNSRKATGWPRNSVAVPGDAVAAAAS
jgi:S1-C subfamily serine protease